MGRSDFLPVGGERWVILLCFLTEVVLARSITVLPALVRDHQAVDSKDLHDEKVKGVKEAYIYVAHGIVLEVAPTSYWLPALYR